VLTRALKLRLGLKRTRSWSQASQTVTIRPPLKLSSSRAKVIGRRRRRSFLNTRVEWDDITFRAWVNRPIWPGPRLDRRWRWLYARGVRLLLPAVLLPAACAPGPRPRADYVPGEAHGLPEPERTAALHVFRSHYRNLLDTLGSVKLSGFTKEDPDKPAICDLS